MSYNKVIIIGRLTRDPDTRYTPKGDAVTEISLAVSEKYKAVNGEPRESTTFLDVEFWGKTAENVGAYFFKGKEILVEGSLQQDTWEDKQTGVKKSKIKIKGQKFEFVGPPAQDKQETQPRQKQQSYQAQAAEGSGWDDETIPF